MDSVGPLQLRIVDTQRVRPHETADPGREKRIEARLRQDRILRDPLMVGAVADVDGFVLLDGTNRQRALATLGFPRVMVQVIDYANQHEIVLKTWCHTARRSASRLIAEAAHIPGLEITPLPPLGTTDALASTATLAVVLDRKDRYALVQSPDHEASRVRVLCELVALYEDTLVRLDCDPDQVEEQAQKLDQDGGEPRVLVAFPSFSRSQVVAMAMGNNRIPAGITRHLILGGRALRVNIPIELLGDSLDESQASAAFEEHLKGLQPRLYREPTVLFDS